MKKQLLLILAAFCMVNSAISQPTYNINISTGIDNLGGAVPVGGIDPNWRAVVVPNLSDTITRVTVPYPGYWEPTPVNGTNAGWINCSGTLGSNTPGYYTFERTFLIPNAADTLRCDFNFAADDSLVSWALVSPSLDTIPIPVDHRWGYSLAAAGHHIGFAVPHPADGLWRLLAKAHFIDNIGALLASGSITYRRDPILALVTSPFPSDIEIIGNSSSELEPSVDVFPNPFTTNATIRFLSYSDTYVRIYRAPLNHWTSFA